MDEGIRLLHAPLRAENTLVVTVHARPPWRSFGGVRIDGVLSHGILSRYAWTLDFDQHDYAFRRP